MRIIGCLLLATAVFAQDYVENALVAAGSNRGELEKVLAHYRDNPRKLEAARFLIANMPGHG